MLSVQCHRVIIGVFNRHQFCIFHPDKDLIIPRKLHVTSNVNRHFIIIAGINGNAARISVSLYLIIATLFDGIARCRNRRNCFCGRLLCLRAHAAFRCGVPLQRERAHRQGGCHHARRKRCTDEPHTLFTHSPRSFVF